VTRRSGVGAVVLLSAIVLASAIVVQGGVLAPDAAASSDERLIAVARDTDEAREFERNNTAPPQATVDRSGRIAVDLRSGAQARLRVFIGAGPRVEGFLLECPGRPIATSNVMQALQAGCR
jgi:hypothetical protein